MSTWLNQFSVSKLDVKLNGYALFSYNELKFVHLHVVQYHLQCIALEQAPAKCVCKACEVYFSNARAPLTIHLIILISQLPVTHTLSQDKLH
jgi:hypothetical protein